MPPRRRTTPTPDPLIRVTQVRSGIGTKPKHRGTLRALGLRGIGQKNVLPDRPEIRGMLQRVPHLVSVETVPEASEVQGGPRRRRAAATDNGDS